MRPRIMVHSLVARSIALCVVLSSLIAVPAPGQSPDRSKPPEPGPPASLKLPPIRHERLSNGLPVVIMEKHELPLVQVELLIRAGSAMDPEDRGGLSGMTADMLEEGAGGRTSLQLADAIDVLGASINAFSSTHTSMVSLHTPLSKLDSALQLMADIALRPSFPAEELERKRKERLTTLLQWHDEPSAICRAAFSKILFGDRHPYGRLAIGTEQSIRSMKREDLKKFYDTFYHAGNAAIIVVGDVQTASIVQRLDGLFGTWRSGAVPAPQWPVAGQVTSRGVFLIDKPEAAQSIIRIGRIGAKRSTEDYFALTVLNTILGGSFTSRLNQNLREEHGYTYGAGSAFDFRPMPGPFVASASVQTDVTDKALLEFLKELSRIMKPVTPDELTRAKNYLSLGYAGGFESISGIASQLSELVIYGLPDDYFNTYTSQVQAVTLDQVTRAAATYLDPDKIDIVIVGDRKKIEKGITALNPGPLKHMSIDDILGRAPRIESH